MHSKFLLNWKSFVSYKFNLFLFLSHPLLFFFFHFFAHCSCDWMHNRQWLRIRKLIINWFQHEKSCISSFTQTATERLRQFQMNGGPQHGFEETIHRVSFAHILCLFNLYIWIKISVSLRFIFVAQNILRSRYGQYCTFYQNSGKFYSMCVFRCWSIYCA